MYKNKKMYKKCIKNVYETIEIKTIYNFYFESRLTPKKSPRFEC